MKTSVTIPDELVYELRSMNSEVSMNFAVNEAIRVYVADKKAAYLASLLGTFDGLPTIAELEADRAGGR